MNRDVRHFGEMVTYMDKLVGQLVSRLEELGIRENTLILFVGDNGTGRGVQSRMGDVVVTGAKRSPVTFGMHVPMIASWPGSIGSGTTVADLVDTTDFLPTLLDAAGVEVRADLALDGRSFLPQLQGRTGQPRDWIYSWYSPRQLPDTSMEVREFAFNARYKLYRSGEVFDMSRDIEEQSPLSVDSLTGEAAAAASVLQRAIDGYRDARPAALDRMFEQRIERQAR